MLRRQAAASFAAATTPIVPLRAGGLRNGTAEPKRTRPTFRDIDDARTVIREIAVDEADAPLSDAQQKLLLDRLMALAAMQVFIETAEFEPGTYMLDGPA